MQKTFWFSISSFINNRRTHRRHDDDDDWDDELHYWDDDDDWHDFLFLEMRHKGLKGW